MQLLHNKTALVTGASRGIGYATSQVFLEQGARVAIADISPRIQQAAGELAAATGCRPLPLQFDLADPAAVQANIDAAVQALGGLDILVSNAGVHLPHPFLEFPLDDFERVFRINVTGSFLVAQAAARCMAAQGRGGSIVFIASASAKKPDPQGVAYNASKSAVVGMMRVLALELGPLGIRANAVLPGATDTEMLRGLFEKEPALRQVLAERTPLGRMAQPRDQANAALFLASDLASHITGEQLVVSGGEFMET